MHKRLFTWNKLTHRFSNSIFAGFTANLVAANANANAWRWQFASSALPAVILLGQLYATPESPRFLMKRGNYVAAFKALLELRGEPILAAKELLYAHKQMAKEMKLLSLDPPQRDTESASRGRSYPQSSRIHFHQKLKTIFTKARTRRALLAASVVMISQQLCGVCGGLFMSNRIDID